jgi:hypothetical protein
MWQLIPTPDQVWPAASPPRFGTTEECISGLVRPPEELRSGDARRDATRSTGGPRKLRSCVAPGTAAKGPGIGAASPGKLRLAKDIDQETFARKHTEIPDRLASIKLQLDVLTTKRRRSRRKFLNFRKRCRSNGLPLITLRSAEFSKSCF